MSFEEELRAAVAGEVRSDAANRCAYAVDASIFEIPPRAIFFPVDKVDMAAAVNVARLHAIPIVARGAATGITGGCLTDGLLIDCSKTLDQILEINLAEEWVRVQPGVVQETLNQTLAPHGYRLGPDTSTGNRATIGGMIANNSAGAHSLRWGSMVDAVLEVELLLSSGEFLTLNEGSELNLPSVPLETMKRSSSGYKLNETNPAKLICGSEGSLGLITEAKLQIVREVETRALCILSYPTIEAAATAVASLNVPNPLAVELIDGQIVALGRLSPSMRGRLDWLDGEPGALLLIESDDPSSLQTLGPIITDEKTMGDVWALRKSGLGLLMSRRTYSRAVAFLEDVAVPPDQLLPFLGDLQTLLARHGKEAGIYGHAGEGALHVRPYMDLRQEEEVDTMLAMTEEATALLRTYGGTLSSEHGDGRLRSWLGHALFGKEVMSAFEAVKATFDPDNLMSPGLVVNGHFPRERLRQPATRAFDELQFDWSKEGGIQLAADMCNGNGRCRKQAGLMCPSFQAHHDEFHSTRARAQGLRAAMRGDLPLDSGEVKELLHYCLECKGCKSECPSQVDMAKMKAEFLHHYHKTHRRPMRDRLFAHLDQISRVGQRLGPITEWFMPLRGLLGITKERPLPTFAKERFSAWAAKQPQGGDKPVILLSDTYTEFYVPQIGQAAHRLLSYLGYQVIVPPYQCCGRALISKGYLPQAKAYGKRLYKSLDHNLPIISLEPSCHSAMVDDLPDLGVPPIAAIPIETLLIDHLDQLPHLSLEVGLHHHCHSQALADPPLLLDQLATPHLLKAGCCGMAGSFGYATDTYDFSLAVGERQLFPQVRALGPEVPIVANGFSCRNQIAHACDRPALHLVELLARSFPTA